MKTVMVRKVVCTLQYLFSGEHVDVVWNEFDPVRENGQVRAMDDTRVGPVHPANLERVRTQLVRAEDIPGDVGHHQRY